MCNSFNLCDLISTCIGQKQTFLLKLLLVEVKVLNFPFMLEVKSTDTEKAEYKYNYQTPNIVLREMLVLLFTFG